MSLKDLLGQYSQDINARIQHEQDHDQEITQRKANTVEEHFQNVKDAMEAGGQELGTAGMAIHLGRKAYKAYKAKYANKPGQSGDDTNPSTSSATEAQATSADDGQAPAGQGEVDTPASSQPADAAAKAPEAEDEPASTTATEAPETSEAPVSATEAPSSSVPEPKSLSGEGDFSISESMGKLPEAPETEVTQASEGITGDSSSLTDTAGNLIKSGVKKAASGGLDDALGAVGDILDFSGPLGEIAGLGLGLYGLIKGLEHKHPKTVVEQNQQQQQVGAGLDASALKEAQPVVGTVV